MLFIIYARPLIMSQFSHFRVYIQFRMALMYKPTSLKKKKNVLLSANYG